MSAHIEDQPLFWLATAAATLLALAGVKWLSLHRAPPPSTWVVLETRWAASHGRLLGLSIPAAYHSRATCRASRPLTGTVEFARHPVTKRYQCVLVGRAVPW